MDLKQEISLRIKQVKGHLEMTTAEFAKACGVEPQTIRDYENAKSIPGGAFLSKLTELDISIEWVLNGVGQITYHYINAIEQSEKIRNLTHRLMTKHNDWLDKESGSSMLINDETDFTDNSYKTEPPSNDTIYIDSYPEVRAAAGSGQLTPTDQVVVKIAINAADWRNYIGLDHRHIKLITVHGDSMKPSLSHGDQVLVDTAVSNFVDDSIYAIQQGDLTRFKRIKLRLDGSIQVKSDNEKEGFGFETYSAEDATEFKLIGRVIPFKFGRFDL